MTETLQSRPRSLSRVRHGRAGALAGMVAGPLFLLVVAILSVVELDDMHALGWGFTRDDDVPYPSGLALGDAGFVLILSFVLAGALVLTFAAALHTALRDRRAGRVAPFLSA